MKTISYGATMLLVGFALATLWVVLLYLKLPNSDDLIGLCKYGLTALVTHYLTYADPAANQGQTTITIPKDPQP